ncbi:MAG: phosphatidate cytidylyltransferase [Firmicutes bacterium]|nr:phosphatidate cytidylyltransferase [Bacillota bacterium]
MLRERIGTALVGIPLLFFLAYVGGYWYSLIILVVGILGLKEYFSMMKIGGWKPTQLAGYLFLPLALLAVHKANSTLILTLWVFIFITFALFPVFFFTKVKYWEAALSFWGVFYTGGLSGFLIAIRLLPAGFYLTIFLLILVWSADVSAFFTGKTLGKNPLAPRISPQKTWEGTIGGLLGSTVAGVLGAWFFPLDFLNLYIGAMLGLLVGSIGMLGDLNQSVLKRSVNVKDTGDLLPGHGGILDRFDSLLFAAPIFYIFIHRMI